MKKLKPPIKKDNTLEGNIISKVLMNRNKDKDFVKRAFSLGEDNTLMSKKMYSEPASEEFNSYQSHKMATREDDKGQEYMFPTIRNHKNEDIKVPNQYKEYISEKGYKNATGMDEYTKGTKKLKKYARGIQNVNPNYDQRDQLRGDIEQKQQIGASIGSTVAESVVPGSGAVLTNADMLSTKTFKDSNGEYKNNFSKSLDNTLNPLSKVKALSSGNLSDIADASTFGLASTLGGEKIFGAGSNSKLKAEREKAERDFATLNYNKTLYNGTDDSIMLKKGNIAEKGMKLKGTKVIEIEGKKYPEIHTNSKFELKTLGKQPHYEGGTKVIAEEGDVVFPTQTDGKYFKKIAKAVASKDFKTLEKERQKLPEDSGDKMVLGEADLKLDLKNESEKENLDYLNKYDVKSPNIVKKPFDINSIIPQKTNNSLMKSAYENPNQPINTDLIKTNNPIQNQINYTKSKLTPAINTSLIPNTAGQRLAKLTNRTAQDDIETNNYINTEKENKRIAEESEKQRLLQLEDKKTKRAEMLGKVQNLGNTAADLSPTLFNMIRGAESPARLTPNYVTSDKLKYRDTSDPLRKTINQGYKESSSLASELSGGNISNIRANKQTALNRRINGMNQINTAEAERMTNTQNANTQIVNQDKLYNLGKQDQKQLFDLQSDARKQDFTGKGLEGLSKYNQTKTQMKNQEANDAQYLEWLKESGYAPFMKKAKGVKKIK